MRITNGMVTNNILLSLNRNKFALSTYEQQLATGKKIQKPSDDPIVAVRALKFRSNVREVEQYKSNAKDAVSWMNITSNSITNVLEIVKKVRGLCVQGSSDTFNIDQRKSMISSLEQLKEQLTNEGNVDYAGRHVFTGYKTDKPLTYTEGNNEKYKITQKFSTDDMEKVKKIIDKGSDTNPKIIEVDRIRLGYSQVKIEDTTFTSGGNTLDVVKKQSTDDGAYEPEVGKVYLLEDTGELIFNSADRDKVKDGFDFNYNKEGFKKGDLNPIHYYKCEDSNGTVYDNKRDSINYQISYNQNINVNTLGKDLITIDLVRDLEEIIKEVSKVKDDGSRHDDLLKDSLGDKFSSLIGKMDKHKNNLLHHEADLGTRINRLDLTINRLEDDKLNFTELLAENENIDIAEVMVKMKAQEMVYNGALMASGKIVQATLLDFIR
jgi:flagellar hook-associated protein 3 FlgL